MIGIFKSIVGESYRTLLSPIVDLASLLPLTSRACTFSNPMRRAWKRGNDIAAIRTFDDFDLYYRCTNCHKLVDSQTFPSYKLRLVIGPSPKNAPFRLPGQWQIYVIACLGMGVPKPTGGSSFLQKGTSSPLPVHVFQVALSHFILSVLQSYFS